MTYFLKALLRQLKHFLQKAKSFKRSLYFFGTPNNLIPGRPMEEIRAKKDQMLSLIYPSLTEDIAFKFARF